MTNTGGRPSSTILQAIIDGRLSLPEAATLLGRTEGELRAAVDCSYDDLFGRTRAEASVNTGSPVDVSARF